MSGNLLSVSDGSSIGDTAVLFHLNSILNLLHMNVEIY